MSLWTTKAKAMYCTPASHWKHIYENAMYELALLDARKGKDNDKTMRFIAYRMLLLGQYLAQKVPCPNCGKEMPISYKHRLCDTCENFIAAAESRFPSM